jgi:hypothetical protein
MACLDDQLLVDDDGNDETDLVNESREGRDLFFRMRADIRRIRAQPPDRDLLDLADWQSGGSSSKKGAN